MMADSSEDKSAADQFICSECGSPTAQDNDFCPSCGSLFKEKIMCENHPSVTAIGACVICCSPYCSSCGRWVNKVFLCTRHSKYELIADNARVFGSNDAVQVQYAESCLKQEGLHPTLYSRKASPISLGTGEYTLFRASGEYDGHIINEIKLMVPYQEVEDAERVLKEIELLK